MHRGCKDEALRPTLEKTSMIHRLQACSTRTLFQLYLLVYPSITGFVSDHWRLWLLW
jgi:hypothetical protein